MPRVQEKDRETLAPAPACPRAAGSPWASASTSVAGRFGGGMGPGWEPAWVGREPADPCRPQNLVRWCDSSPCKNGGKCWQTNAQYRCECHSGWTGLYCDVPSVSCEVAAWQQGDCPLPARCPWRPLGPGRARS